MSEEDVKDAVADAAETVKETAKRIRPRSLASVMIYVGEGSFALAVSITSGIIAAQKFRAAYALRNRVTT